VYGRPVTDHSDSPVTAALHAVWARIRRQLFPDGAAPQ
jgi:hypothetical protein